MSISRKEMPSWRLPSLEVRTRQKIQSAVCAASSRFSGRSRCSGRPVIQPWCAAMRDRSRARLGITLAPDQVGVQHRRQVLGLLLGRAVFHDHRRTLLGPNGEVVGAPAFAISNLEVYFCVVLKPGPPNSLGQPVQCQPFSPGASASRAGAPSAGRHSGRPSTRPRSRASDCPSASPVPPAGRRVPRCRMSDPLPAPLHPSYRAGFHHAKQR